MMTRRKAGRPPVKRSAEALNDDIVTLLRLRMSVEKYEEIMKDDVIQKIDALVGDLRVMKNRAA